MRVPTGRPALLGSTHSRTRAGNHRTGQADAQSPKPCALPCSLPHPWGEPLHAQGQPRASSLKAEQLLRPNPWGRHRQRLGPWGEGKKPGPQLLRRWQPHLSSGAQHGHRETQSDTGDPTAWAPEGEAKAGRLLLTAPYQAAMVRFRQGHRVGGDRPPGSLAKSQLATSSRRQPGHQTVAERAYALPAGECRGGEGLGWGGGWPLVWGSLII